MQTTKNRVGLSCIALLVLAGLLAGCTPPGARALLDGKRLLDAGDTTNAIARLEIATTLLPTNAVAWNYLGLARHHAGQVTNAAYAYHKALTLHPDLLEARFNLGCLWLEHNRHDLAKMAFTAYTLRRPGELQGWLKLGLAQLHLRETAAAERSFQEALRLSPKHPQACNGLGFAALQGNRPREAAQRFAAAAQSQPVFRPALLNLAITLHQNLKDQPQALQRYREYLALTPRAADWEAVNATAHALEQELAKAAAPPPTNIVAQAPAPEPVVTKPAPAVPPRPVAVARPEPTPNADKPSPPVVTKPAPPPPTQTVQVAAPPEIKPAQDTPPPTATAIPRVRPVSVPPGEVAVTSNRPPVAQEEPGKRSLLARMNPMSLFKREPKREPRPTPLPGKGTRVPPPAAQVVAGVPSPPPTPGKPKPAVASLLPKPVPRYAYRTPVIPTAGNRSEAEQLFTRGAEAQHAGGLLQAMQAYRAATQADPAYFEAYYNLGLAALQAGNLPESLAACEGALALMPDSRDARYNFALGLKQGGYLLDAAIELERLVARHANDTRARVALANLYAQQLRQPAKARDQYLKVLEIEPRHAQADAIRYWLVQNPG